MERREHNRVKSLKIGKICKNLSQYPKLTCETETYGFRNDTTLSMTVISVLHHFRLFGRYVRLNFDEICLRSLRVPLALTEKNSSKWMKQSRFLDVIEPSFWELTRLFDNLPFCKLSASARDIILKDSSCVILTFHEFQKLYELWTNGGLWEIGKGVDLNLRKTQVVFLLRKIIILFFKMQE